MQPWTQLSPGNRYGKSLHELRDVFRTQWTKAPDRPAPEVGEFLMGHGSGDPNEYDKFYKDVEWVQDEYLKALPMLQIVSSGVPFGLIEKREIKETEQRLEARIRELESEKQSKIDAMSNELEELKRLVKEKLSKEPQQ